VANVHSSSVIGSVSPNVSQLNQWYSSIENHFSFSYYKVWRQSFEY